jgi:hypothetical protein
MKIPIPIYTNATKLANLRRETKRCSFSGCTEMYSGVKTAKYCALHSNPALRRRLKDKQTKKIASEDNIEYKHSFENKTIVVFNCRTCESLYEVEVYPKQFIYPANCNIHMNKFKRDSYNKKEQV